MTDVQTSLSCGLFRKVDCYMVFVTNLDEGLKFYSDILGHEVL